MRVIQLFKIYWPDNAGGIAKVMEDVACSFDRYNQMMIVCASQRGKKTCLDNYCGRKVLRCRQQAEVCSTPVSIDFIRNAGRIIQRDDIVIYHFPYPMVDIAVRTHQIHGRLVVWWHCDVENHKLLLPFYKRLIFHTLEKAERIIVSSREIMVHSEYLKKFRKKCRVIPFCMDDSYLEIGRKKFQKKLDKKESDKKEIMILFVGRLVWYKGCDVLLEAFAKMQHKNCTLVIAGTGPLEYAYKKLAVQLGIGEDVRFEGRVSEKKKQQLLAECDFLALPSISKAEAFGVVQIEAMAFGKPVINTSIPSGVPRVSLHGVTGLTVAAGQVDELADAMKRLAEDKELRLTYGKNAMRRVAQNYTQQQMRNKCEELLAELEGKYHVD